MIRLARKTVYIGIGAASQGALPKSTGIKTRVKQRSEKSAEPGTPPKRDGWGLAGWGGCGEQGWGGVFQLLKYITSCQLKF